MSLSGTIFQNTEFKLLQEFKERLLWTTLSAIYNYVVGFFNVRIGTFTTLDVVADVLTMASGAIFLTVLKTNSDFTCVHFLLLGCDF